jgi:hypothetical protein
MALAVAILGIVIAIDPLLPERARQPLSFHRLDDDRPASTRHVATGPDRSSL